MIIANFRECIADKKPPVYIQQRSDGKNVNQSKTVRIISALSSTLLCGGQPAIGPTRQSFAYSYKSAASLSLHGRRISLSVSRFMFSLFFILFISSFSENCRFRGFEIAYRVVYRAELNFPLILFIFIYSALSIQPSIDCFLIQNKYVRKNFIGPISKGGFCETMPKLTKYP